MASFIKDNFIFKSKSDASCRVCNKELKCPFNGNKRNITNLYRHWHKNHSRLTVDNRGTKYPTLKRLPCDINNEGPQAKYHKAYFDQYLKHFKNIETMKGGGVINEDENNENSDNDNESNDIDENSDNDMRINEDSHDVS